ncbi:MAG: hypothetical protein WCG15_00720 [Actinomycetes bacterium]|jgi:hypothetical protein
MTIVASIKKPTILKANTSALVKGQSNPELVLKTVPVSPTYFNNLLDVYAVNPANGDVVIYNSTLNKYEVKPLTLNLNLDGGTF